LGGQNSYSHYFYDDEDYGHDYDGCGDEEEIDGVKDLEDKNPTEKSMDRKGKKVENWGGFVDLEDLDRQDDEENEDTEWNEKHGGQRDGNGGNRRVDRKGPASGAEQASPRINEESFSGRRRGGRGGRGGGRGRQRGGGRGWRSDRSSFGRRRGGRGGREGGGGGGRSGFGSKGGRGRRGSDYGDRE
jgi:hypothetical protein